MDRIQRTQLPSQTPVVVESLLVEIMSRFFCVCHASCESPVGCTISPQRDRRNSQPGYHIHRRDLKKIHRAACAGDVRKVQRVLFLRQNGLDERDRKNRTALHLASANGHGGVVTLLLERGCQIDARDRKKRTALIKAVQCEAEECVEILLKSGANVNAADVLGNTALHYAACLDTTSIAEKLLSHAADVDMKNQDDLTPLLLARRNNRQLMADFLKEKQAHMPTVEKTKSEHKDERRRERPFQTTSLAKTSDCEESPFPSGPEEDARTPGEEEGVPEPKAERDGTRAETLVADEGAAAETTEDETLPSVLAAEQPDESGEESPFPSGPEEDARTPGEEEGVPEPKAERDGTRAETLVADEGAAAETTEDETLPSVLAAEQPDESGEESPFPSGPEEDARTPGEEEGVPEPKAERDGTRAETLVADEGAAAETTEDETLPSVLAAEQPDESGEESPFPSGPEEDARTPGEEEGVPEPKAERDGTRAETLVADEGAAAETTEDETLPSVLAAEQPDESGEESPFPSGPEEDARTPGEEEGVPEPKAERDGTRAETLVADEGAAAETTEDETLPSVLAAEQPDESGEESPFPSGPEEDARTPGEEEGVPEPKAERDGTRAETLVADEGAAAETTEDETLPSVLAAEQPDESGEESPFPSGPEEDAHTPGEEEGVPEPKAERDGTRAETLVADEGAAAETTEDETLPSVLAAEQPDESGEESPFPSGPEEDARTPGEEEGVPEPKAERDGTRAETLVADEGAAAETTEDETLPSVLAAEQPDESGEESPFPSGPEEDARTPGEEEGVPEPKAERDGTRAETLVADEGAAAETTEDETLPSVLAAEQPDESGEESPFPSGPEEDARTPGEEEGVPEPKAERDGTRAETLVADEGAAAETTEDETLPSVLAAEQPDESGEESPFPSGPEEDARTPGEEEGVPEPKAERDGTRAETLVADEGAAAETTEDETLPSVLAAEQPDESGEESPFPSGPEEDARTPGEEEGVPEPKAERDGTRAETLVADEGAAAETTEDETLPSVLAAEQPDESGEESPFPSGPEEDARTPGEEEGVPEPKAERDGTRAETLVADEGAAAETTEDETLPSVLAAEQPDESGEESPFPSGPEEDARTPGEEEGVPEPKAERDGTRAETLVADEGAAAETTEDETLPSVLAAEQPDESGEESPFPSGPEEDARTPGEEEGVPEPKAERDGTRAETLVADEGAAAETTEDETLPSVLAAEQPDESGEESPFPSGPEEDARTPGEEEGVPEPKAERDGTRAETLVADEGAAAETTEDETLPSVLAAEQPDESGEESPFPSGPEEDARTPGEEEGVPEPKAERDGTRAETLVADEGAAAETTEDETLPSVLAAEQPDESGEESPFPSGPEEDARTPGEEEGVPEPKAERDGTRAETLVADEGAAAETTEDETLPSVLAAEQPDESGEESPFPSGPEEDARTPGEEEGVPEPKAERDGTRAETLVADEGAAAETTEDETLPSVLAAEQPDESGEESPFPSGPEEDARTPGEEEGVPEPKAERDGTRAETLVADEGAAAETTEDETLPSVLAAEQPDESGEESPFPSGPEEDARTPGEEEGVPEPKAERDGTRAETLVADEGAAAETTEDETLPSVLAAEQPDESGEESPFPSGPEEDARTPGEEEGVPEPKAERDGTRAETLVADEGAAAETTEDETLPSVLAAEQPDESGEESPFPSGPEEDARTPGEEEGVPEPKAERDGTRAETLVADEGAAAETTEDETLPSVLAAEQPDESGEESPFPSGPEEDARTPGEEEGVPEPKAERDGTRAETLVADEGAAAETTEDETLPSVLAAEQPDESGEESPFPSGPEEDARTPGEEEGVPEPKAERDGTRAETLVADEGAAAETTEDETLPSVLAAEQPDESGEESPFPSGPEEDARTPGEEEGVPEPKAERDGTRAETLVADEGAAAETTEDETLPSVLAAEQPDESGEESPFPSGPEEDARTPGEEEGVPEPKAERDGTRAETLVADEGAAAETTEDETLPSVLAAEQPDESGEESPFPSGPEEDARTPGEEEGVPEPKAERDGTRAETLVADEGAAAETTEDETLPSVLAAEQPDESGEESPFPSGPEEDARTPGEEEGVPEPKAERDGTRAETLVADEGAAAETTEDETLPSVLAAEQPDESGEESPFPSGPEEDARTPGEEEGVPEPKAERDGTRAETLVADEGAAAETTEDETLPSVLAAEQPDESGEESPFPSGPEEDARTPGEEEGVPEPKAERDGTRAETLVADEGAAAETTEDETLPSVLAAEQPDESGEESPFPSGPEEDARTPGEEEGVPEPKAERDGTRAETLVADEGAAAETTEDETLPSVLAAEQPDESGEESPFPSGPEEDARTPGEEEGVPEPKAERDGTRAETLVADEGAAAETTEDETLPSVLAAEQPDESGEESPFPSGPEEDARTPGEEEGVPEPKAERDGTRAETLVADEGAAAETTEDETLPSVLAAEQPDESGEESPFPSGPEEDARTPGEEEGVPEPKAERDGTRAETLVADEGAAAETTEDETLPSVLAAEQPDESGEESPFPSGPEEDARTPGEEEGVPEPKAERDGTRAETLVADEGAAAETTEDETLPSVLAAEQPDESGEESPFPSGPEEDARTPGEEEGVPEPKAERDGTRAETLVADEGAAAETTEDETLPSVLAAEQPDESGEESPFPSGPEEDARTPGEEEGVPEPKAERDGTRAETLVADEGAAAETTEDETLPSVLAAEQPDESGEESPFPSGPEEDARTPGEEEGVPEPKAERDGTRAETLVADEGAAAETTEDETLPSVLAAEQPDESGEESPFPSGPEEDARTPGEEEGVPEPKAERDGTRAETLVADEGAAAETTEDETLPSVLAAEQPDESGEESPFPSGPEEDARTPGEEEGVPEPKAERDGTRAETLVADEGAAAETTEDETLPSVLAAEQPDESGEESPFPSGPEEDARTPGEEEGVPEPKAERDGTRAETLVADEGAAAETTEDETLPSVLAAEQPDESGEESPFPSGPEEDARTPGEEEGVPEPKAERDGTRAETLVADEGAAAETTEDETLPSVLAAEQPDESGEESPFPSGPEEDARTPGEEEGVPEPKAERDGTRAETLVADEGAAAETTEDETLPSVLAAEQPDESGEESPFPSGPEEDARTPGEEEGVPEPKAERDGTRAETLVADEGAAAETTEDETLPSVLAAEQPDESGEESPFPSGPEEDARTPGEEEGVPEPKAERDGTRAETLVADEGAAAETTEDETLPSVLAAEQPDESGEESPFPSGPEEDARTPGEEEGVPEPKAERDGTRAETLVADEGAAAETTEDETLPSVLAAEQPDESGEESPFPSGPEEDARTPGEEEGVPEPKAERDGTRAETLVADEGAAAETTEDETLPSVLAAEQPDESGEESPFPSGPEEDARTPGEEEGVPEPKAERDGTRAETLVADEGAAAETTEDETLPSVLAAEQPDESGEESPFPSGPEEDARTPGEEEGVPEPKAERDGTRAETLVADEGAAAETTEDETLPSVLAAEQPDESGEESPFPSGPEEDARTPGEEEGVPEPKAERDGTRAETLVADEGAAAETTEDETLPSVLAAEQPDESGEESPFPSGPEEDARTPGEEEGVPEPKAERDGTRAETLVADEGAPGETTEDETLPSVLAAEQPNESGRLVYIPGG
ncbi:uncharacterized protein [Vicugna pacos]|uniref:Ankyrin repeat domain-containing protein 36C n=1 Tax=Vicugna pacos TaxID=30538 RepID=A0ABM5BWI1_VICPA